MYSYIMFLREIIVSPVDIESQFATKESIIHFGVGFYQKQPTTGKGAREICKIH